MFMVRMMPRQNKLASILCWTFLVLCLLSACVMVVVGVWCIWTDESISRNETEWLDGGGRHVSELPSVKLSDGD